MPERIRVLLADDHPIVRSGLRHELEQTGDLLVVAEVSSVGDVLETVRLESPQVAVLGVEFPDGNGIEVCGQVRSCCPETRVLIFTAFDRDDYLTRAWTADASGYVVKEADTEALIGAIRRVARSERIYTQQQLNRIRVWQEEVEKPLQSLTSRETEVLELMAENLTNAQVAFRLNVSLKTAEVHVQRVRTKLGLATRRDAIVWARRTRSSQL